MTATCSWSTKRRLLALLSLALSALMYGADALAKGNVSQNCDAAQDACYTAIIKHGATESPKKRAKAFIGRGSDLQDGCLFHFARQRVGWDKGFDVNECFERAIADFDAALRIDPNVPEHYATRAAAYSSKGLNNSVNNYEDRAVADFDHAVIDYNHAIRLDPNNASFYAGLGLAYFRQRDFSHAIALYDRAIRIDPKIGDYYEARGRLYEEKKDLYRARADFEAALALNPEMRLANDGLARLAAATPVIAASPSVASPSTSPATPQQSSSSYSCAGSRRVALIVGNSAYSGGAHLTNPINDADDVSALLRDKLCFKVIEAKDANFASFSQKLSEFIEAADGADVALFYFAGHGMQFQHTNYLLPVDAKLANELDLAQRTISAQNVGAALESRAKVSLLFLDACRDNPIEDDFRRRMKTAQRSLGDARGLAPMTTLGAETLIVFATRPNHQAADGSGRNSPFTRAFLEHFATPGKDVELVMRDVTSRVLELTNGQQIPQRLTELRHGLVLLPAR